MMAREIRKQNKVWISNKEVFIWVGALNIVIPPEVFVNLVSIIESLLSSMHYIQYAINCYKTTQPQSIKSEVNPTV